MEEYWISQSGYVLVFFKYSSEYSNLHEIILGRSDSPLEVTSVRGKERQFLQSNWDYLESEGWRRVKRWWGREKDKGAMKTLTVEWVREWCVETDGGRWRAWWWSCLPLPRHHPTLLVSQLVVTLPNVREGGITWSPTWREVVFSLHAWNKLSFSAQR